MTKFRIATVALAALLLVACSSTPDQPKTTFKTRIVTILTEPPGAQVTQLRPFGESTRELGLTPIVNREVEILTYADTVSTSPAFRNEVLDHAGYLLVLIRKDGFSARKMRLPIKGSGPQEFRIPLGR